MAISASGVWEVRTTGSDSYGGVFDTGVTGYGTDYTQQNAPILALTDVVTTSASATVTSVTGGFTSAMIGNGFNIAGTMYVITAVASTTSVTVDRAVTTGATAQVGNVGGACASPGYVSGQYTATIGNIIWIKAGTYNITSATPGISGGTFNQITLSADIIGYNVTRGDSPLPTSGNQPDLVVSAGINTTILEPGTSGTINFIKIDGTLATTGTAIYINFGNCVSISFCESILPSTNTGINIYGFSMGCYAHGGGGIGFKNTSTWSVAQGITSTNAIGFSSQASHCIAVGCYYGFEGQSDSCIAYNGNYGFANAHCINCYAEGCTLKGFSSSEKGSPLINCASFNTTNAWVGPMVNFQTLTVSGVVNAAGNNFAPASSGKLVNTAFSTLFGLSTSVSMDIGVFTLSGTGGVRGPLDHGPVRP